MGFAIEGERAAVFIEQAKLQRELMELVKCGDALFAFENILRITQALPRQKTPKKIKKDVSKGLHVVSLSKL